MSITFGGGGGGGGGYTVGADILSSADWYHHSIIYKQSTPTIINKIVIRNLLHVIVTELEEITHPLPNTHRHLVVDTNTRNFFVLSRTGLFMNKNLMKLSK